MKIAEGIGAWHNQYNTRPLAECAGRAQRAQLDFVIVKYGLRAAEQAYAKAGVPWATERYVYINQPEREADMLAAAVDNGAVFAVINAEEGRGGWGPAEEGAQAIETIATAFSNRHPAVALYACLDTRGDRLNHPYQQAALHWCDGIMPMIYPGAFRPGQPLAYIVRAFDDALKGKDFGDQRVYPVLQSYGWDDPPGRARTMGAYGIRMQAGWASPHPGCSFYTLHHATDAEWDAVCALKPKPKPEPLPAELLLREMQIRSECVGLANSGWLGVLHDKLHAIEAESE